MEKVTLTCIGCPLGCSLTVEMEEKKVIQVTGNTCKNGEKYAHKEMTAPVRTVTSTVRVQGGVLDIVSVKTADEIPKDRVFDCIRALKQIEIPAPVSIGQVIIPDVAETGVDIVATKDVPCR